MNSSTERRLSGRVVAAAVIASALVVLACERRKEPQPGPAPVPAPTAAPEPAPPAPNLPPRTARHSRNPRRAWVRDSIARAAFLRDSLERDRFIRDSLARDALVRDSLARVAFVRDSLVRLAYVEDSIRIVRWRRDSLALIATRDSVERAKRREDSAAKAARADSLYGANGAMPRIEGDVNITHPTGSLQLSFVDQVWDDYQQVQVSYARPFSHKKASWQIDVPVQHWDSTSGTKTVTSLANVSLSVNRRLGTDSAMWRQTISLTLTPQTGLEDPSVGNNQWIVQPQYTISRWFGDHRVQFRALIYWQYGFAPDTAAHPTKRNIIVPRLVLSSRVNSKLDATLDLRPRIDITRDAFYSTLMIMISRPIGEVYGLQAGYEFPLDSMARQKVEKAKLYFNLSRTF